MASIRDMETTVELEIDLGHEGHEVRIVLHIYGTLTEKARGRLNALVQALPTITIIPPPSPPEPPTVAAEERVFSQPPERKR